MSTNNTHNQTTVMPSNTQREHHTNARAPRTHIAKHGALIFAMTLAALSFWTAPALADYEQASEHFGTTGETAQLEGATGIAINTTGAGGVEPGSIYAAGANGRVVRYGPGKESKEPPFKEAWGWGIGNGNGEYQRCGPALPDEPTQHTFSKCMPPPIVSGGGEEVGDFGELAAVAVDQETGDVYVRYHSEGPSRLRHLIEVFTATGSPIGEGFGDQGRKSPAPSESIGEGPEKLHQHPGGPNDESLAVDEAGVVYVTDEDFREIANPAMGEARIMSFAPEHEGDYEHYMYTGQSKDISVSANGLGGLDLFSRIALTDSGDVVATNGESVLEYSLGVGSAPICRFLLAGASIQALAANSVTGEVYFFNHSDSKLHTLGACDSETGQFAAGQTPIGLTPATKKMFALAVNPVFPWSVSRPEGVVYAVDGERSRSNGDIFVPAKSVPPSVVGESVVGTTVDSTVLRAEVNPNGFATTYHFQYLSVAEYSAQASQAESEGKTGGEVEDAAFVGASEVPSGQGVLATGGVGVAVASVTGLTADTEYRFRVVVSNSCDGKSQSACVAVGGVGAFGTYPFALSGLSDGRVYELVSPPEKHGGEVFPADPRVASCEDCKPPSVAVVERFPMQSAPDGDGVVYMGYPFNAGEGAVFNEYSSQRTASGWQTTDMSPPLQATHGSGSLVFSTGLGRDLLYQESPQLSPTAPVGYANLYLQEASAPGVLMPLMVGAPPNRPGANFKLEFAGASPDLSRAFFSANDALTGPTLFAPEPSDPGVSGRDLYEWHEGTLALVNVLPGNTGVATGATFASAKEQNTLSADEHGVSVDGSRVFWSAGGHLYVRVDGQETQEVSDSAGFQTASADGLEVLLSNGAIARYNGETGVYEQAADVTEGEGGFQGILGSGEENGQFAHMFFVDTQVLPGGGENEREQAAQLGQDNLYVWEAEAPRFIATLGAKDETGGGVHGALKDWSAVPVARTAEASPDGRWLAFGSESPLTGYDSRGSCVLIFEQWSEGTCREVFIYNTVSGRLVCASCNPTGEAPRGPSTLRLVNGAGSENGTNREWFFQPRYVADTGRVVFDSGDRLSALDSNGRVEDVYEFEPNGVGTCVRQAGCVLLISPGTGSVDSNFLAMDETGKNVFFTTRERLVAQDKDELIDVYDAREQGGFASETETQRTECQGEACQSTPAPSLFTTPGSATFAGAGNMVQPLVVATTPQQRKTTVGGSQRSKALTKCRKQRSKRKRVACERKARKSPRRAINARTGRRGVTR